MKESEVIDFGQALEERYFAYALSTIVARSLPDLRDGLKPVHRRLLYAMRELGLDPKSGYKKCARIVGDVIGKFHPHGEVAVYDALVRMAQSFSMRYPVVEGQGNFGSIDGDAQAAMRYTEAKLTPYAMMLMADIESGTVDFRATYDGSESEPMVMPSAVPNILANGAEGIAVGMATSIPPHNIMELFAVLLRLLDNPQATVEEMMDVFHGPDFPTGGQLIYDKATMLSVYSSGRGAFKLRAMWEVEELKRGRYQIIIKELPYQVNKRKLIEQMAELYQAKKLQFLETFQDQSSEDVRIVLVPKTTDLEAEQIMASLYALTDLEVNVNINLNVLDAQSRPSVMGLTEILLGFLEHRKDVLKKRIEHRLSSIAVRLEVLSGLLIVYLHLDEVIRIIRTEDEPKVILMQRFTLSDAQAEFILSTRLRALRKLEEFKVREEHDKLSAEQGELIAILKSPQKFLRYVKKSLEQTMAVLAKDENCKRKTQLLAREDVRVQVIEMPVQKHPLTVTLSSGFWLKAMLEHGHTQIKYRPGDEGRFVFECSSADKIVIFSTLGKFYSIEASAISRSKGDGEPLRLVFDFADKEAVVACFVYQPGKSYLVASHAGRGFRVMSEDVLSYTRSGKNILSVGNSEACFCQEAVGEYIVCYGQNRRLLVFKLDEVPYMKRGKGVILQKFKGGGFKKLLILGSEAEVLEYLPVGFEKVQLWMGARGKVGRLIFGKTILD